jgi:hypothetical protein
MSRKAILCATMLVALSACEATRGGGGMMTDGEPIIGELFLSGGTQGIKVTSVDGWSCTGTLTPAQARDAVASVFQVPLSCTNSASGNALVSIDRLTGDADINFRLSNGKSGSVQIGRA